MDHQKYDEPSLFEPVFKKLSILDGAIEDLPEDFAENHDYYIHGTPKLSPLKRDSQSQR